MDKEPIADFDELALLKKDHDLACPADQYAARLIWLGKSLDLVRSTGGGFSKVIAHPYDPSKPKIIAAPNDEGGYSAWKESG